MNASKWMILGALAGIAGLAINKQLRLQRQRLAMEDDQAETAGRASIDDVPTVQGVDVVETVAEYDERVAPAAPF